VDDDLVVAGDHSERSGLDLGHHLLDLPQPPDAVVICNNQMTLGFLRAVSERGLRVPKEIALIAFDDADWATLIVPPLTVIGQPVQDMGRVATTMLLERMHGSAFPVRQKVLPAKLIVRGSC
jgi:DNA-binding LacI/PurR family transcriptional regulator